MAHKICKFYKKIYLLSKKIPKRDRFGIFLKIESVSIETMALILEAAFEIKPNKINLLNKARINIEILKRFFTISSELKIVSDKAYFSVEIDLQEISKMINGWIKYLKLGNTA
ncbi:hypothetical protein A2W54_00070 [Candidatus Giovannonibacteria bacterium RIFCSPHIGHO2_02_43_13]|uniref:bAvd-like domain-containing protein n=1 Tax=Candidatus Giovannonibacteria bacterium RIFCSPHIGHO2_02_43_13 TaxID=1798330 RepID=A0A1F5WT51_9BACT|nr:MAG: hypothetical protein A3E06_03670 [Candidatus Giovannonibacteria bacterium RIFCSPHIGHO2_12_FULL_44_42]OGF78813.1 MAG: hypothetical protein A2W54_00070 [Candidatus Giovannonibacteria bacterium RIFCSPHIGHO2_02_43_13]OGF89172.1 MAG: hypothetical protein A3I94_00270 [Candidatus Giovannonibacteria bacterium RIFCSPLOWO2_02_FULL_43_54]OGF97231.1 MAG: hypothetical protein A3H08_02285 [Candidatus Giovannonibacteria bacterium RIFCSPLOWO2_12_FULL_44_32]